MQNVRQTADAVLDSRFLVSAGELAIKKTANSLRGDATVSLDLDQFVSKCISFMRLGGRTANEGEDEVPASTQTRNRRRTTAVHEDDDEEESGDGLDWAILGSRACFPTNRRPPVASFLLGPLSVQKRVRTTQIRRARSQKQPTGPATRPQELQISDIKQSESANLTHLVTKIKNTLMNHLVDAENKVTETLNALENPTDEMIDEVRMQHRTYRSEGSDEVCVALLDFIINPNDFGQTVENLFYVSFLIKEGGVKILYDKNRLPLLSKSLISYMCYYP
jgi:non-structural maintenance of chromosomes element 4